MSERGSDDSRIPVRSRHLAPYYSDFRPLAFFRGAVNEGDFFPQIETVIDEVLC